MEFATVKQTDFISKLSAERGVALAVDFATLTKSAASVEIARLLALPKAAKSAAPAAAKANAVTTEGVFRNAEGVFFRVVFSAQGRLYAKQFNGTKFEYVYGAIATLTEADRLSIEDAAAFGFQFGICVVCSRELSDPESVARGIGPVCATKGWWR